MVAAAFDFLAGGGSMGERIRALDWSKSELGAPDTWPKCLQTMAGVCLHSGFPMCLFWGPKHVQIYNDGFMPILGSKHPTALGESAEATWREIWDFVQPRFRQVREEGRTVTAEHERLFIIRSGYPEETFFTFSYSPIRDEQNRIEGILCVVTETTQEVVANRRLRFVQSVAAEVGKVRGLDGLYGCLEKALGKPHPSLPFTAIYEADAQGAVILKARTGVPDGVLPESLAEAAQSGLARDILSAVESARASGQFVVMEDAEGSWQGLKADTGDQVRKALLVPLDPGVEGGRPAFLIMGTHPRRLLDEPYHGFLALLAGHVETALHNAWSQDSERKRAESQAQSQKLEAIGRLAGGIAHDFNNLLTAINGFTDLSIKVLDGDSPVSAYLAEIHKAGHKAASLTNQLLAYSRKQIMAPRPLDLRAIVADMDAMLQRVISESVTFVKDIPGGDWIIRADKAQVEQALMNLVLNGADAMPQGGPLTLSLSAAELSGTQPGFQLKAPPGDYVVLTVADQGWGMGPEILAHLFEPFFTTKEKGKGTGLGLATVHGILKQNNGAIRVESEPRKGTRFHLYFPRAKALESEVTQAVPLPSMVSGRAGQGRIILLAEDETAVRTFVSACLRAEGYRVWDAPDGREAIRMYESRLPHVDLLLTDVVMPNMGGRELAEWFLSQRPDGRVLFMSGYTEDDTLRRGISDSKAPFLAKPFSGADLCAKVLELLADVPGRLGPVKPSGAAASSRA